MWITALAISLLTSLILTILYIKLNNRHNRLIGLFEHAELEIKKLANQNTILIAKYSDEINEDMDQKLLEDIEDDLDCG